MNQTITAKSTLEEAYMAQELVNTWSSNSKKVYRRNIKAISNHMKSIGLDPILENVTYNYGKKWLKDHSGHFKPSTLNQQKSTMTSLFRHLNNDDIITGNPFLNVKIPDYTAESYLSKDLDIVELYQVYKAAHELQANGVDILAPILLDIYTGLRSTNLIKLKVNSLDSESSSLRILLNREENNSVQNLEDSDSDIINSKNREGILPLPPKAMGVLLEYAKDRGPNDSLLYGLRGKAFANKQMNYIVKKICEHLRWIVDKPISEQNSNQVTGKTKKIKTDQYFTPHGLRYSVATIFHNMGVEDNALRMLLLHSKLSKGALARYTRRDSREVKQIRMAQMLLETVLETALEIEDKFGVQVDLETVYEQLPIVFENVMKNVYYLHIFKDQMIRFAFSQMEQMISNPMHATYNPMNQQNAMNEGQFPAPAFMQADNQMQQVGFMPGQGMQPPYFNQFQHPSFHMPSMPGNEMGSFNIKKQTTNPQW